MDDSFSDERKRKYFLWGTVLTWTLAVPLIIGIFHAFRGISEQKATGLGAVAGGLAEAYAIFGLFLAFVLPRGGNFPAGQVVLQRAFCACPIFAALHLLERTYARFRWPVRVDLSAPYN